MKIIMHLGVSIFLIAFISCSKKILVNKEYVVNKTKGVAIFIDKGPKQFRNIGLGDVFIDSLIPDFFIPYNFGKTIIEKKEIESLFSRKQNRGFFFYLKGDCNEMERTSLIKEGLMLTLDKNLDGYLQSKKVFILPIELRYLKINTNKEYYELHNNLEIEYKQKKIKILFKPGYLEVLRMDVLQYDWSSALGVL